MKGCEYSLVQCTIMTNQNTMMKCIRGKDHHNGKPDFDSLKGRWTLEELGFTNKKKTIVGAREKMPNLKLLILWHWLEFKFTQTLVLCITIEFVTFLCGLILANDVQWTFLNKENNKFFFHPFWTRLNLIHFLDVQKKIIQWKLFDH
jgi:hypothetical protein